MFLFLKQNLEKCLYVKRSALRLETLCQSKSATVCSLKGCVNGSMYVRGMA